MGTTCIELSLLGDQTLLRKVRRDWYKAWRDQKMPPVQKQLLQAIYQRLGNELHTVAGQETLGQDIGRSARTVGRHLPALVKAGWIMRQERVTRNGRTTDKLQIAIDGNADFFCPQPRQNVVAPLTDCRGEKETTGKASEQSSSAAYAREDRAVTTATGSPTSKQAAADKGAQGSLGQRPQRKPSGCKPSGCKPSRNKPSKNKPSRHKPPQRKPSGQTGKESGGEGGKPPRPPRGKARQAPVLAYVRDLLGLWKELVQLDGHPAPPPDPARLGDYRADELETALATLLERIQRGGVISPKGLFMHLVEVIHRGEVQPRRYDAASLRRIAAGQPRHHVHGVQRRLAPEPPPDPEALRQQAQQEAAAEQRRQQESQAKVQDDRARMEDLVRGTTAQQPGDALEALAAQENVFLAAEVLAAAWGWSSSVAFGELHRTRQAQTKAGEVL